MAPLSRASCAGLMLALGACASPQGSPPSIDPFTPPGAPVATLIDADTVNLTWEHHASAPGGYWVEFATPGADFVKLEVAWPSRTSFRHEDVAPATRFMYRLIPFFGRASNLATVTTGAHLPNEVPALPEGPVDQAEVDTALGATTAKKSIRAASTFIAATPSVLSASLATSSIAELRWEDRSVDEDGYLVEMSEDGRNFTVCGLLPPNATSFRKVSLPPARQVFFRVRAFFEGAPSKLAVVTTPPEVTASRAALRGSPRRGSRR